MINMERPYVQNRLPLSPQSSQSVTHSPFPSLSSFLPILIIQRNDGFPRATDDALLSLLPAAAAETEGASEARERCSAVEIRPFSPLMRDHARNYMVIPGGNVHQLSWALA